MQQSNLLPIIHDDLDFNDFRIIPTSPYLYENFYSKIRVKKLGSIQYVGRSRPQSNCGKFSKAFACNCKTTFKVIQHTCYKLTCPICYQKGIHRAAERITERFKKIKKLFKQNGIPFQLQHISLNTQWRIDSYETFRDRKKELIAILKKEGLHGIILLHGWRKSSGAKKLVPWKTDPSKKKYKFVARTMNPSPHFHFLGVNRPRFSPEFKEKYGFTYTNITYKNYKEGKAKKPYIKNLKSVKRLVRYLLSHVGIVRGKHTTTWFNQFSYNRMNKTNIRELKENSECKHCHSLVYQLMSKPIKFKGNFFDGFKWYFSLNIKRDLDKVLIERYEKYDIKYKGNLNIFQKIYIYD